MLIQERAKLLKPFAKELGLLQHKDIAFRIIRHKKFLSLVGLGMGHKSAPNKISLYMIINNLFVYNLAWGFVMGCDIEIKPYTGTMSKEQVIDNIDNIKHFFNTVSRNINELNDIPRCLANGIIPYCSGQIWRYFNLGCTYLALEQYEKAEKELLAIRKLEGYAIVDFIVEKSETLLQFLSKKDYEAIEETMLMWQHEVIGSLKIHKLLEKYGYI